MTCDHEEAGPVSGPSRHPFAALERALDPARGPGDGRGHRRLLPEGRDWLEEQGRHEETVRRGEDHRDDPGPWNDPSGIPAGGGTT